MKRGYCVMPHKEADYGYAVVANSVREAKKPFWDYPDRDFDNEFIDIVVKWSKNAIVDDLNIGVIDDPKLVLAAGIYESYDGCDCEKCGKCTMVYLVDEQPVCSFCHDQTLSEAAGNAIIKCYSKDTDTTPKNHTAKACDA